MRFHMTPHLGLKSLPEHGFVKAAHYNKNITTDAKLVFFFTAGANASNFLGLVKASITWLCYLAAANDLLWFTVGTG